jgi:hypothetical protein
MFIEVSGADVPIGTRTGEWSRTRLPRRFEASRGGAVFFGESAFRNRQQHGKCRAGCGHLLWHCDYREGEAPAGA